MDTPSGTLGASDFSPMGPAFSGFGDENMPLPMEEAYGVKLSISRSGSTESGEPPVIRRRKDEEPSPISGFMSDLAPLESGIHGIPRSPLRHS